MTSEFKKEMIYLATHEMKATEERILKAYNKEFGKNLVKLTEGEFSILCAQLGTIISEKTKGEQDAISQFTRRHKFSLVEKRIVREKGTFYIMFLYLMIKLKKVVKK